MKSLFLALSLLLFSTPAFSQGIPPGKTMEIDPHSFAQPWAVEVQDIYLNLKVDFQSHTLKGRAVLKILNKTGVPTLHLDTRDLKISSIQDASNGLSLTYSYGRSDKDLGQELIIHIGPTTRSVVIDYETSPGAHAVQWLEPEQTTGKHAPFLFTQSQSIHARSWIPLQDTPEVRVTYSADIQVPSHLMALMSAENPQKKNSDGRYHFKMPQPIPSYLIALAVGDLEFQAIGPRTGVYAEASGLKAAAWELANMEKILSVGEEIAGQPYAWERYDTLVLPPSFPFGGMENPRLTFATPTVITGDRSLESLHAHEASHSWTGNLVTNKNANHFWLNEGFTVYLERRIIEGLYGLDAAETQGVVAMLDLKQTIDELEPQYTKLRVDLSGVDPDEVYSVVPYEKGYLFLRHIEDVVGRPRFDEFLRAYITHFKFRSIGTDDFLAFLESELIKGDASLAKEIDALTWIDQPGLPKDVPVVRSLTLETVDAILLAWQKTGHLDEGAIEKFGTFEWAHFLTHLPADLTFDQIKALDERFGLTKMQNAEIVSEWLRFAVAHNYGPALERSKEFLNSVGRGKFVKPLFGALVSNGHQDYAQEIFTAASPGYHNIIRTQVARSYGFEDCASELSAPELSAPEASAPN